MGRLYILLLRVIRDEQGVLVKNVEFGEAGFGEDVELVFHRARRIFLIDVGEDLVAHFWATDFFQMFAVARLHECLDGGVVVRDQVGDKKHAAGTKPVVEISEHRLPLGIVAEMVKDLAGEDEVEPGRLKRQLPHIGLDGFDAARGCCSDSFIRAIEHRLAEIDENAIQRRDLTQNS